MLTTQTMRTNPATVREVLAAAAASNAHAASKQYGFNHRTVRRWQEKAAAEPGWPTDSDVEAWETAARERGPIRAARSAQRLAWAKRVYVTQGLMLIDATGTTRRLQALYALGWTGPHLGRRLGISPARVGHLVSGARPKVHRDTAAKVAALYDELCMVVPADPDVLAPKQSRIHARQRRQSAAKGWAPPLAWDDIDDPNETPTGLTYRPSARAVLLDELLEQGAGLYEILRALDLTRNTFNTWCVRHGYRETYLALVTDVNESSNAHVQRRAS